MEEEYEQQPAPELASEEHPAAEERFDQDGPGLFGGEEAAQIAEAGGKEAGGKAEAAMALYRRYRPDSFAEVIGQDHVTTPLRRALANNRVNHAYLFSGPRGCGKTTSARILARCLNCEQGPTDTPCGSCRSCIDLARGGPGSIDVIEIDAASHGGVDDARELRERAFFAPVHSRYKVYIVDEAHMVTTAGFNALLKLVEEPPPHAKFVFATTEPEKVIGTIRSRTHHYPFRLVPPKILADYLAEICESEKVPIEQAVLPLVVRAGAGSVRDSLSVLDQLLGGAGDQGVEYEQAAALLGFTPDAMLDEILDAFAAGDGAGVFKTVDKVIEVGQDPRRFAEDLLRRLRDLVILAAVPDAARTGLLDVSEDQAERLATQVSGMGPGELARDAELIANGLTEMRGTTAPRLHLELMCARVLLPGADVDERGLHARLDRLERRIGVLGTESTPPPQTAAPPARSLALPEAKPQAAPPPAPAPAGRPAPEQAARPAEPAKPAKTTKQRPAAAAAPTTESAPRPGGAISVAELRRLWPGVLEEVKRRRRFTYMMLSQNAQVLDIADGELLLGFGNQGARENFVSSGSRDVLAASLAKVVGVELRIQAITSANAPSGPERGSERPRQRPAAAPAPERKPEPPAPSLPPQKTTEPMETAADDAELTDPEALAGNLLETELGATVVEVKESS